MEDTRAGSNTRSDQSGLPAESADPDKMTRGRITRWPKEAGNQLLTDGAKTKVAPTMVPQTRHVEGAPSMMVPRDQTCCRTRPRMMVPALGRQQLNRVVSMVPRVGPISELSGGLTRGCDLEAVRPRCAQLRQR